MAVAKVHESFSASSTEGAWIVRSVEKVDEASLGLLCSFVESEGSIETRVPGSTLVEHILSSSLDKKCVWLASFGSEPVGIATAGPEVATSGAMYARLGCLFVRKNFRNQGIGTELMKRVSSYAKQIGIGEIQW